MSLLIRAVTVLLLGGSLGAANAQAKSGKETYDTYCVACHAPTNIMVSSPKRGVARDWEPRLKERGGLDALAASALAGRDAMPPKGNCAECQIADLKAAIQYMMAGG